MSRIQVVNLKNKQINNRPLNCSPKLGKTIDLSKGDIFSGVASHYAYLIKNTEHEKGIVGAGTYEVWGDSTYDPIYADSGTLTVTKNAEKDYTISFSFKQGSHTVSAQYSGPVIDW